MRPPAPPATLLVACALVLCAARGASAQVPTARAVPSLASAPGSAPSPGVLGPAQALATGTSGNATTVQSIASETPVPVSPSTTPPAGRRLSSERVLEIARALPKMKALRAEYPSSYDGAYLKGPTRWQVSFFSKKAKEIGQVIIVDETGQVLEQWTGFQVAWTMARGYPGAFGRHVNSLYIWLPLCLLFMLPFVDPRRPLSMRHLDLLVLLSFSVSLAFFDHGRISESVPLTYPPLLYLLARMLWLLRRPAPGPTGYEGASAPSAQAAAPLATTRTSERLPHASPHVAGTLVSPPPPPPAGRLAPVARPGGWSSRAEGGLRLLVPVSWLAFGVVFLLGFRIALNVTDSNVIDVGYAGVIGAQKIVDGKRLYGGWPQDNEHGDTYGPSTYEAYVPFQQIFGWSGTWDDLPAAHAAAIVFDLLALGLMFLIGWRIRGPTLGVALAYAWVSYPFTLFALNSNSNDTLVAVFVLAALLFAGAPAVRGGFAALAGLAKFAPLALAPVLATHGLRELPARRRGRALAKFLLAFVLVGGLVAIPAVSHDSLATIFKRTLDYQANRGSPFSVWGLYGGMHGLEVAVQIGAIALALALAVLPRRAGVPGLAAACAAIMIAAQLGVEHWFYLYIPWFFPLAMIALLSAYASAGDGGAIPPGTRAVGAPDGASGPARSTPLAVASPSSG